MASPEEHATRGGGRRSPRWDWSRRRCAGPSVPSRLGRAGPVRVGPGPENIVVRSPESEPDMPVGWARDRRGSEIKPGPVQAEFCFARETRAPPRPAHRRRDSSLLYSCLLGYGHGDSLARWRRLSVTGKRASGLQLQGAGLLLDGDDDCCFHYVQKYCHSQTGLRVGRMGCVRVDA